RSSGNRGYARGRCGGRRGQGRWWTSPPILRLALLCHNETVPLRDEVAPWALSPYFQRMTDAGTAAAHPLVELVGVNQHSGDLHVLQDINLSVATGEVVVVIGPSGSGKSTLCRAINRLET